MLVNENCLRFKNLYIYTKTLEQPKYKLFKRILAGINGVKMHTFFNNNAIIPPEKV